MASNRVIAATVVMILVLALPQAQPMDGAATKCQPPLLLLLPCMPYAQGFVPSPSDECCDNLRDVEDANPECLCLFVEARGHSPVPAINRTHASQLPGLCHVPVDTSHCRSDEEHTPPPASPEASSPPQPLNGPCRAPAPPGSTPPPPQVSGFITGAMPRRKERVGGASLLVLASIPLLATLVSTQLLPSY